MKTQPLPVQRPPVPMIPMKDVNHKIFWIIFTTAIIFVAIGCYLGFTVGQASAVATINILNQEHQATIGNMANGGTQLYKSLRECRDELNNLTTGS